MDARADIQDAKTVYVAWKNTDLTEGRGWQVPHAVAETQSTAIRMGRNGDVQGSDCTVTAEVALKVNGRWLVPGVIHGPTEADRKGEERARARRDALERAKAAGLSEDDIKAIQGAQP